MMNLYSLRSLVNIVFLFPLPVIDYYSLLCTVIYGILHVGTPFPPNFKDVVKTIFKRLFRVYAHIYHSHFQKIVSLKEEAHLNTCFKHFILFTCVSLMIFLLVEFIVCFCQFCLADFLCELSNILDYFANCYGNPVPSIPATILSPLCARNCF